MKKYKITIGSADPTNGPFGGGGWRFAIERRRKYASISRTDAYGNLDSRVDNIPLAEFEEIEAKYTREGVHDYFMHS